MSQLDPEDLKDYTQYKLTLRVSPSDATKLEIQALQVDKVSWHTIILQSLKKFHGSIGAAIQVEIIENSGLSATVLVHKEDGFKFTSALMTNGGVSLQMFGVDDGTGVIDFDAIPKRK